MELDERGRSSTGLSMAAGGRGLDSAGVQLKRTRDGAEEVRGDAAGLWARRIEKGRRVWPTGTPAMALSSSSARCECGEGKGMAKMSTTP